MFHQSLWSVLAPQLRALQKKKKKKSFRFLVIQSHFSFFPSAVLSPDLEHFVLDQTFYCTSKKRAHIYNSNNQETQVKCFVSEFTEFQIEKRIASEIKKSLIGLIWRGFFSCLTFPFYYISAAACLKKYILYSDYYPYGSFCVHTSSVHDFWIVLRGVLRHFGINAARCGCCVSSE